VRDGFKRRLYYVLDGHVPRPVENGLDWAQFFERGDRIVQQETLSSGLWLSTVFLGIDHRVPFDGPPLLFESMVFDPDGVSIDMERCSTWEEAEEQHRELAEKYRKGNHDRRR
jgi:hypothetical protein